MRDNVKATKALVDEYLGARRNVFNDAGEEYEHPHPQLDMFADLMKFSLRYNPGEDEVIDRFVKTVDLARETGVHFLVLTRMQIMLNMALSEGLNIDLRKKAMNDGVSLFATEYIGVTLGLALNYGLSSVETRKTAMTLFCDIYEAATL